MVKVVQHSFTGGQLDFQMLGRQDFNLYKRGASRLENFNIQRRGCISKRQGFDRIASLTDQSGAFRIPAGSDVRLVPFAYTKEHGFVLVFDGEKAFAVCTSKGRLYRAWTIVHDSGAPMFSGTALKEFDYCQCGYKLYLAHQGYHPSVIQAKWSDLDAAVNADTPPSESPFEWIDVNFAASLSGVPSIREFSQTRVPPTKDSCGGLVTERYKVSAVFDGIETQASDEAYSETYVAAVSLGTDDSGNEIVQKSKTGTVTTTVSGSTQTTDPATTTIVTAKREAVTCDGSSYLAPWVDGQTIDIYINAAQKNGKYPDELRVYKKSFGYFGLIGSCKMEAAEKQEQRIQTSALPTTSDPYETIPAQDAENARTYDEPEDFVLSALNGATLAEIVNGDGRDFAAGSSLVLTPKGGGYFRVGSNSKLSLRIGRFTRVFDRWVPYGSGSANYHNPTRVVFTYKPNACGTVRVTLAFTYKSGGDRVEGTTYIDLTDVDVSSGYSALRTYNEWPDSGHEPAGWSAMTDEEKEAYRNDTFRRVYGLTASEDGHGENFNVRNGDYSVSIRTSAPHMKSRLDELQEIFFRELRSDHSSAADGQGKYDITLDASTFADLGDKDEVEIQSITISVPNDSASPLTLNGVSYAGNVLSMEAKFTDTYITPDTSITPLEREEEAIFTKEGDFPACVCLSQQRLVWASTKNNPETIWASATGDFTQYTAHEVGTPEDAIEFALPVTRFAKLNHLVEMRQLLAFNDATEWVIGSNSTTEGISGSTIQARPQSYVGSAAHLKPVVCNNAVLFCERTGQAVRRFAYDIANDGFAGKDVSILSCGIFAKNKIIDWAYQQFPNSTLWCVLADGTLASLVYMEEQDVVAWSVHKVGATTAGVAGKVKAIATSYSVSPFLDEVQNGDAQAADLADTQEIFAVVERGGAMWLERMRPQCKSNDSVYHALTLDSMRVQVTDSTPMTAIAGYRHYDENGGEITVAAGSTEWKYEGLPVECNMETVYPVVGNGVGSGQMDIKDIVNVNLRMEASVGGLAASTPLTRMTEYAKADDAEPLRYGDNIDDVRNMAINTTAHTVELKDCDCANVKPKGVNTRDGRLWVGQAEQWPFTIVSMELDYATETEGANG